jgi:putative membrane protein
MCPEQDQSMTNTPRIEARFLSRAALAGALMGLANLVPGISGGTMLVACGVYTRFIEAVSDLSRLRVRRDALITVGVVVTGAAVAIVALAGVVSYALAGFRWGMFSLFIGLTIGGVPTLWRLSRPHSGRTWAGLGAGLAIMLGIILLEEAGGGAGRSGGVALLVLAGVAGAAAMILPGISGAYLLLLLGQYERIIDSIKSFVHAGAKIDVGAAASELRVLVPVGIGVVVGIAGVSNLLRFVLHRYRDATLGVLLGLLIGAPLGLYPFRAGVEPAPGDTLADGAVVTAENIADIKPRDWDQRLFTPGTGHVFGALALVAVGAGTTLLVGRLGRDESQDDA